MSTFWGTDITRMLCPIIVDVRERIGTPGIARPSAGL